MVTLVTIVAFVVGRSLDSAVSCSLVFHLAFLIFHAIWVRVRSCDFVDRS